MDIIQDLIQLLSDKNEKENGVGSTEGKAESNKAKGGGGAEGAEGADGGSEAGGAETSGEAGSAEQSSEAGGDLKSSGSSDSGMNWLEKLAEAMATIQNKWLEKADKAQAKMNENAGDDDTGARDAFVKAQSQYTAAMQMFSMVAAATSTSLKSLGEGLAGIARKQ